MLRNTLLTTIVAYIFAPSAVADVVVNNWCDEKVTIVTSQGEGCDSGPDGCTRDGHDPWRLDPGSGQSIWRHPWAGDAVSIKIGKEGKKGILQYEYSSNDGGIWWNLSDLDGGGPGLVGTPFQADNVGITPSGAGAGKGTCIKIRCAAHKTCADSYQDPADPKTKYCPRDTGDMTVDLCMPRKSFGW